MTSRDIFAKALPNIKLATRFDADGNEIQVWLNHINMGNGFPVRFAQLNSHHALIH